MKSVLIAVLVIVTLIAVACGADSGGVASLERTGPTPTATAGLATADLVEGEVEMIAFTECMREQGLEMTDPVVDSDGNVDKPGFPADFDMKKGERALDACVGLLEGLTTTMKGTDNTDATEELLALASCLRDQGFDVDDPVITIDGPGKEFLKGLDLKDPRVAAAFEDCGSGPSQGTK